MSSSLKNIISRYPLRIACCVIALICAAAIYYVTGQLAAGRLVLEETSREGSRLAENVGNGSQLAGELDAIKSASSKISQRFVSASQLANNLQYFYRLETEAGVELIDLRQTTSGDSARSKVPSNGVGFAVAMKGDYPAILTFLRRLENGPHYCRVLTAGISGTTADRNDPLVMNLSLELFGQL
jgi:hypothetical protein